MMDYIIIPNIIENSRFAHRYNKPHNEQVGRKGHKHRSVADTMTTLVPYTVLYVKRTNSSFYIILSSSNSRNDIKKNNNNKIHYPYNKPPFIREKLHFILRHNFPFFVTIICISKFIGFIRLYEYKILYYYVYTMMV